MHTPWLFSGGIDIKAGQWVTLEGAETIDPTTNYFYSHSYIFNFGIPFVDTGILAIAHVDPLVDIYAGIVTGVNTTFGNGQGDNNGAPAFEGGIGLNLLGGSLTILATTHIGPETPAIALIVLEKTSRPARATTISWTPSRPIVTPEWRHVQPLSRGRQLMPG